MKIKWLLLIGACIFSFAFQGCGNKECEEQFLGNLCYRNKSNVSKIDIYMDGEKLITLDTLQDYCIDDIRAGEHSYVLNYVQVNGGAGKIISRTIYIPPCESFAVEIFD